MLEVLKMPIRKYFCPISKLSNEDLPDSNGSLNLKLHSSAIVKVNALVTAIIEKQSSKEKSPYLILMPAQKFQIGKQASETWCNSYSS